MIKKSIIGFAAVMMAISALATTPGSGKFPQKQALQLDTDTWIDANRILLFVTNKGSFGFDQGGALGKLDGLYYPYTGIENIYDNTNVTTVIFASGVWIGAVNNANGDTLVSVAEYSDDYYPGPIVSGSWVPNADILPQYRVYKLYSDSLANNPNADYLSWPISQGAPFVVDSVGDTIPDMIGDQMCWAVYNDLGPAQRINQASTTQGLGVEIKQSTFAFDRTDPLGDVVFVKFQIFNKGGLDLADMFVSLWADPDLGGAGDDFVGSDTILSMGFCYNSTNSDGSYGSTPPAVGYDFFQGPLIFTGDNADTAKMWDTLYVGYQNMPMTSFNKYINGTDPESPTWTYQYMNGLDASLGGTVLPNGTKFAVPGDPVTGTGDLDVNASDRRYLLTTGPFDFAPGDSTEILAAIIVARGGDRKSSVSVMKYNDKFAQQAYDFNFVLLNPPAAPIVIVHELNGEVGFEWTDTSEVDPGDYPFQGYSVFQCLSASDPGVRIANFDTVDGFAIILDEVLDPLTGVLEQRAVKFGTDNGVRRYFGSNVDFINDGPLHNYTEYFYRIEAYSYSSDPLAAPKTLTSATIVNAIPQTPIAGTGTTFSFADTVPANHISGRSDGAVLPLIMDPLALNGNDYIVVFEEDISLGPVWHLYNLSTGDTVLFNQTNQLGDGYYPIVDGMFMYVAGPPLAVNTWAWEPDPDARVITGVNAGLSGFFAGLGLGAEFFGTSLTPGEYVTIEVRWVPDGTGQNGYMYRRDLGYAYDGYFGNQNITVWDVTSQPERQVNFAFVEHYDPANEDGQTIDSIWNGTSKIGLTLDSVGNPLPATLGGREYLFPLLSDYSATPLPQYTFDGALFNDSGSFDAVFALWAHARSQEFGGGKPSPGEVFRLIPNFVNSTSDTFTFTATAPSVNTTGEQFLANIKAVPNPYYLSSTYDADVTNRRMKFTNLPATCTITIYNLAGEFVFKISKDDALTSEAVWPLTNDFNVPVGSGIYIYVVEAPGFGQKIGKMAIFTEIELLNQY